VHIEGEHHAMLCSNRSLIHNMSRHGTLFSFIQFFVCSFSKHVTTVPLCLHGLLGGTACEIIWLYTIISGTQGVIMTSYLGQTSSKHVWNFHFCGLEVKNMCLDYVKKRKFSFSYFVSTMKKIAHPISEIYNALYLKLTISCPSYLMVVISF
jgi:hypothetical protein